MNSMMTYGTRKRRKVKQADALFYAAWILFASTLILNSAIFYVQNEVLEGVFHLARYAAYLLCILKFLMSGLKKKMLPYLIVLFAAYALSGVGSGNLTFPLYGIILLGAIGVDTDRTINITLWLQGIYMFLIISLSQLGIILDYVFEPEARARHGLGFSWTTTGPILFLYFCLCLIYIKREKMPGGVFFLLEAINLWMLYMTDSKMAFTLLTLVLAFFFFQKLNKKRWKWLSKFNKLYICMPFLLLILTLVIVKIYNWYNPLWAAADKFLSYRLGLMQNAYNKYGIHLLGQSIHWVGYDYKSIVMSAENEPYNYVDNSYLQIAFNNGLLFLIIVLCLYSYGIYKAEKSGNYYLVFIYLVVLLLSLTEPRLMNFAYNPFPLIAIGYLPENIGTFRSKVKKRNELLTVKLF